jgi:hypothetical protein
MCARQSVIQYDQNSSPSHKHQRSDFKFEVVRHVEGDSFQTRKMVNITRPSFERVTVERVTLSSSLHTSEQTWMIPSTTTHK